jgi:hypothetical protein
MTMMTKRDDDVNYLAALALAGVAIGVTATLLLRLGASRKRPFLANVRKAGTAGVAEASATGRTIARKVRHGVDRGMEMVEEMPFDDMADHLRDYFEAARSAIDDTISEELRDLKKAIRRKRRRLGI